jgi:hypothetical protein
MLIHDRRSFLELAALGGAGMLTGSIIGGDKAYAAATAQATFTPAASSHVAGDVVGGAQEFKNLGNSGSVITIVSASLRIANSSAETSTWVVYLFDVTPPSAVADDSPFLLASTDYTAFVGSLALAQTVDVGDTQYIESNNIQKVVRLRSSSLFGYLVNGTTLTPGAVAHVVTLGVAKTAL